MPALEVYESGLTSLRLWAQEIGGRPVRLPVSDWASRAFPGDASLLTRCRGAVLDIGCGPGRLVAALASAGYDTLGIDVSVAAVTRACDTGGQALECSVFGPVPRAGRWGSVLLADGNIGIGGDPTLLLHRVRQLLHARGVVLVELDGPGAPTTASTIRLHDGAGRVSEWFAWARVGIDGVDDLAREAGFAVTECWQVAGRWFASLLRS